MHFSSGWVILCHSEKKPVATINEHQHSIEKYSVNGNAGLARFLRGTLYVLRKIGNAYIITILGSSAYACMLATKNLLIRKIKTQLIQRILIVSNKRQKGE